MARIFILFIALALLTSSVTAQCPSICQRRRRRAIRDCRFSPQCVVKPCPNDSNRYTCTEKQEGFCPNVCRSRWRQAWRDCRDLPGCVMERCPNRRGWSCSTGPYTQPSPSPTPQAPSSTPQAPSSTPQAPSSTPQAPSSTPQAPSSTPQAPSSTPQAPSSTPQAPSSTPQAPSSTPQAPSSTPQAPSSTPQAPSSTPQAPSSTPAAPTPTCAPPVCDIFSKPDPSNPCECTYLLQCDSRQRVRREYRELTAGQRAAFVRAVNAIEMSGVWGQLSEIHARDFGVIHDFGNFFPWHTGLLFFMETLILDLEPSLPGLPYFAWGAEENVRSSTIWSPQYMGGSDPNSASPIPDGPFAGFTVDGTVVTRELFGNNLESAKELTIAGVIANEQNLPFWSTTEISLSDELELLHNIFHVVTGGTMLMATSPSDPIFYLHHAYVDKWWAQDWPATLGFLAENNPAAFVEGLPLTTSYENLGGFSLADSAEIQRCVRYVEPGTVPQVAAAPPAPVQPMSGSEIAVLAELQGTTVQEVEDTAAVIVDSVAAAVESESVPDVDTEALVEVSEFAEQFDVPVPDSIAVE